MVSLIQIKDGSLVFFESLIKCQKCLLFALERVVCCN